jgi:hypothetical protein
VEHAGQAPAEANAAGETKPPGEKPAGEANPAETKPSEAEKADSTKAEMPSSSNVSGIDGSSGIINLTSTTTDAPSNSSAPANSSNSSSGADVTGCATHKDERATSWFSETSPEGTPCVFGVDVRDEGKHCILDNEEYGSNGWCYTAEDRSQWGSCNDQCPLQGQHAKLGNIMDGVAETVKGISGMMNQGNSSTNVSG